MIYALVHPDTLEVRYVGKSKDCDGRLRGHRRDAVRSALPVYRWWRKVMQLTKHEPSIVRLDEGGYVEEVQWIARLKTNGARLLNCTPGGEGVTGLSPEAATKRSRAVAAAWARPESRERQIASLKTAWAQPEIKERHRTAALAAHKRPEVKRRSCAAQKAVWSSLRGRASRRASAAAGWARPETRERHLLALARPDVRERISAASKAAHARPDVKERHRAAIKAAWARRRRT